jgi:hypothetical protein
MAPSEERIGEIESLFRNVNERIAAAADRFDVESAEFYCECHDPACGERVVVPLEEYEEVRERPTRFLHAPDHIERRYERVVASKGRYEIVEKVGQKLAAVVRRLNPRPETS